LARLRVLSYIRNFNLVVCLIAVVSQCPSIPCAFALQLTGGCSSQDILADGCPTTLFTSPAQCVRLQQSHRASLDDGKQFGMLLRCFGIQKFGEGFNFNWGCFWNLMIFVAACVQASACSRWSTEFQAVLDSQEERILLRERLYSAHLLQWRRLELSRIDTKHKVLLAKLRRLMAYINQLRDIWANKRGELTTEERAARQREHRVLDLCLATGASPPVLEPIHEEFSGAASDPDRGEDTAETREDEELPAESVTAVEAARLALEKTVDSCTKEHLEDLEQKELRRITAQEVADRRTVLLQMCQEARQKVLHAGRTEAPEDTSLAPDPSTGLAPETSVNSSKTVLTRSSTLRRSASVQELIEISLSRRVKDRIEVTLRRGVGALIDDFLYTSHADDTLQSHRRHDSLLTLLYKAIWSQTLPFLILGSWVQFALHMSVLPALTAIIIATSLTAFPHAHPRFWKMLSIYNVGVVLAKVIYQLPLISISVDLARIKVEQEHGLSSTSSRKVPWEAVLGLLKVVKFIHRDASADEDPVFLLEMQLEERELVRSSLLVALLPDLLVCGLLFCHWHTLRHSGRLGNPAELCRRLSAGDRSRSELVGVADQVSGPEKEAPQPMLCVRMKEAFFRVARYSMSAVGLRKPARDLFAPRFALLMSCFCIILIAWDSLSDGTQNFAESLTSSSFSGVQVLAVMLFLALLVEMRAEYTWYTQYRWKGESESRGSVEGPAASEERSLTSLESEDGTRRTSSFEFSGSHGMHILQRMLLLTQLIGVHVFYIAQWAGNSNRPARMLNAAQIAFYILCMAYLALTSVQLRYDVHVTSGGLGLTHSMDLATNLAFKAYCAVPFVEEMRVLTDWTVTRTSLDFFMWMKLEDAQQALYRTQRDMMLRRIYPTAAPRPTHEKVLQGGLLLLALFVLIVAPIALFSTLNPSLQSNMVTSATLTGSLVVEAEREGVRTMQIYEATQSRILPQDASNFDFDSSRMDLSIVQFPRRSEQFFDASLAVQEHMARVLRLPGTTARFQVQYTLQLNGADHTGQDVSTTKRVMLTENRSLDLSEMLNHSNAEEASIAIPDVLNPTIRVTSLMEATQLGTAKGVKLTFQPIRTGNELLRIWDMAVDSQANASDVKNGGGSVISLLVASEKSAPVPVGGSSTGSSWSVVGIYLGVVLTVGRFLRIIFQGASKRVIYEELPDTSLLQDLCNGIYIARIQQLLPTEYKLYYQLMHLYRSPELLLNVTGSFEDQGIDVKDEDLQMGSGGAGGTPGTLSKAPAWNESLDTKRPARIQFAPPARVPTRPSPSDGGLGGGQSSIVPTGSLRRRNPTDQFEHL